MADSVRGGGSTIGWRLHRSPSEPVLVDADHRLTARDVANLRLPDAPLIVAVVVDGAATRQLHRDAPGARRVVVCRLRVEPAELRARIAARGGPLARSADAAVQHAAQLDRTDFADVVVDATARSEEAVVESAGRVVA